jgi:hypothetical protein
MAPNDVRPLVIPEPTASQQNLSEFIEICCPVCGWGGLSHDETGQMSCEECDYVEVIEI